MRALLTSLLALCVAAVASAATLDLPVQRAGEPLAPPFYRGDVLELRLAPGAARIAQPLRAGAVRDGARGALGVAGVDATARALGGATFEPEFVGETAPLPGDDRDDLTAFHVVHLPAGVTLEDALARFAALPEVASVSPVAVLPVSAAPNDSLFYRQQWMRDDRFPRHDDRILDAWNVQQGDTSVVVGVLDTGVLAWHPELGGTVAGGHGNLFVNWAEAAGTPGVDDDANGFVDDVSGWDFVDSVTVNPGEDGRGKDNDPSDYVGHGTAIAGIIGAIGDNFSGIAGMLPRVCILPLRCAYAFNGAIRPGAAVDMLAAARCIAYATRMGAKVLNCSWESLDQGGLGAAVTNAVRSGVTLVNASGNRLSAAAYLGQREDVLSVGGVDSTDVLYASTTRGPWLDLVAQATEITSTFVTGSGPDSISYRQPDYRSGLVGTSFAAPQVAAAVALLQAQRRAQGLDPLTPIGAALRVRETADDHHAINPIYLNIGTGRLNVLRALTDPPTSTATRGRARTVGAPVVLSLNTGETRVVYATSDRKVLALDGVNADTLWSFTLPAAPVGHPVGGEFGNGVVGVCVAVTGGNVFAFDHEGHLLPGWPRATVGNTSFLALGDLDGDGVQELVYAGNDGLVGALLMSGGQRAISTVGMLGSLAPALADFDGVPGDEVVLTDGAGLVHVYSADGSERTGWPVAGPTGSRAPIVVALGTRREMAVIVAGSGRTDAFDRDGNLRWSNTYAGAPAQDPFAGDLDGDGVDEILLALGNPLQLRALDSAGVAITRAGWPLTLPAAPVGVPVMGPLLAGRTCVGWFTSAGFVAWDDSAKSVASFPRPGLAGALPAMGDFDGDGATEIALGTSNADSSVYAFDAGALSWNAARAYWPTVRGDIGRRANRSVPASLAPLDVIRPAAPHDLTATAFGNTSVRVRWTNTGDDSLTGRAALVEIRYATPSLDGVFYTTSRSWVVMGPSEAGVEQETWIEGLTEGRVYDFAMRVRDEAGNWSAISNADTARLTALAPDAVADLRVDGVNGPDVMLRWTATGEDGSVGRPEYYVVVANDQPVTYANWSVTTYLWQRPATADAGAPESLLVTGLGRGKRWYFAVRALDRAGGISALSNEPTALIAAGGALGARTGFAIAPLTRPATLPTALAWQAGPELAGTPLMLSLYDMSGRLLRRVRLGTEPAGVWSWDGTDADGRGVPAGMYFARLDGGSRHVETRVVLLR
ncbi:MAG: S8 family serine peptidase [Candidatus Eisenbacteria bacterium]